MTDTLVSQVHARMQKSVEITTQDLSSIRSGRATPALVENIMIAAYGGTQHLKVLEMATITAQDAKTLLVIPYDPSQLQEIERGIQEANAGLTPVVDGEMIRISIPALSEERRNEYIKLAWAKIEAGKVMIRQVRQDAMRDLKRAFEEKAVTEDDKRTQEKLIQDETDKATKELDDLGERKETELSAI